MPTPEHMLRLGLDIINRRESRSSLVDRTAFVGHFGVSPTVSAKLWNLLATDRRPEFQTEHLLWALMKLRLYNTDLVSSRAVGCDMTTYRKWIHIVIAHLSTLPNISLQDRFDLSNSSTCFMSIDGTNCRIWEPTPFHRKWYSHKFHGAGVRYEVGLCLNQDKICWLNGPFPCGSYPDQRIFTMYLHPLLLPSEKVIADGGYKGAKYLKSPPA